MDKLTIDYQTTLREWTWLGYTCVFGIHMNFEGTKYVERDGEIMTNMNVWQS